MRERRRAFTETIDWVVGFSGAFLPCVVDGTENGHRHSAVFPQSHYTTANPYDSIEHIGILHVLRTLETNLVRLFTFFTR